LHSKSKAVFLQVTDSGGISTAAGVGFSRHAFSFAQEHQSPWCFTVFFMIVMFMIWLRGRDYTEACDIILIGTSPA
jgi:preprotein translocase subunit SecG